MWLVGAVAERMCLAWLCSVDSREFFNVAIYFKFYVWVLMYGCRMQTVNTYIMKLVLV